MSQPARRGNDWRPAGVVLAVVGALIAGPSVLAALVPIRETAVDRGGEIELTAPGEEPDTVRFSGVDGWQRRPTGDQTTAVLTAPDGSRLAVSVVGGVTDFTEATGWRLKVLGVQGFDAYFDGGEVETGNGFSGPTCRGSDRAGVCAIVGNDKLAVTLVLAGDDATLSELTQVLETLTVRR
ncbi:hypothetical protein [Nocardia iowensis]|uniref:DUF4245 domain-containing protein n=1 Tax=Nocardia iowensis TaxID=204891 RepID=A0ABX8RTC6_NOCIO|nr:hypothetical protein [Nocardia iowensis]QXN91595.1 hypothetical protein KV110_40985 [Nocardia iowensis]